MGEVTRITTVRITDAPQFKLGDLIWVVDKHETLVKIGKVFQISITRRAVTYFADVYSFTNEDIGDTVFETEEEAWNALKRILKYSAILEVEHLLLEKKIPHEFTKIFDGYIVAYPNRKRCKFDIVQHEYSYGSNENLVEAMGYSIPKNDVEGWLTVEQAVEYFEKAEKRFRYGWKMVLKEKLRKMILSKKPVFWIWFLTGVMNLLLADEISRFSYLLVWLTLMIEYVVWILIMREK